MPKPLTIDADADRKSGNAAHKRDTAAHMGYCYRS